MPVIYVIFYVLSQIGGLYALFVLVLGFIMRPIVERMFYYDVVKSVQMANKLEVMKLKQEMENQFTSLHLESDFNLNNILGVQKGTSKRLILVNQVEDNNKKKNEFIKLGDTDSKYFYLYLEKETERSDADTLKRKRTNKNESGTKSNKIYDESSLKNPTNLGGLSSIIPENPQLVA